MKIRPVSSNIVRRRNSDNVTPMYSAKRDFKILMSTGSTVKYIDSQVYGLCETNLSDPCQISSNEISKQLSMLKVHNNSSKISKGIVDSKFQRLTLELSVFQTATEVGYKRISSLQEKIKNLKKNIEEIQANQDIHLSDQDVYFHIKNRLITTKIFLDMKKLYLQNQIKNKNIVYTEVNRIRLRTSEERCRSAKHYRNLNKTFGSFDQENDRIARKLKKDKKLFNRLEIDRENRFQRQLEIKEEVGVSEKNRTEKQLRNGLILHKLWHMVLSKRLERSVQHFSTLEIAYTKIKSVTGIHDISLLVEKFLTKEDLLSELVTIIKKNKITIEECSKRNENIQEKIKEIMITEKNALSGNKIQKLNSQIMLISCKNANENKNLVNLQFLQATIKNWSSKMIKRLNPNLDLKDKGILELMNILKSEINNNIKPQSQQNHPVNIFVTENIFNFKFRDKSRKDSAITNLSELNFFEPEVNDENIIFALKQKKINKK